RHVQVPLAQGLDGPDGGGGGGEGGHHQHAVQGGALADGAVVVEGLAAQRGVEDDVDLPALDVVDAVGPALVDLVDHLHVDAVAVQVVGGALGGQDPEAHLAQAPGQGKDARLVVVVDADE